MKTGLTSLSVTVRMCTQKAVYYAEPVTSPVGAVLVPRMSAVSIAACARKSREYSLTDLQAKSEE